MPPSPHHRILHALWDALPTQFGTVVSVGVELGEIELGQAWTPPSRTYFAELERTEPTPGRMILAFELPLAIACAGQLVLLPDGQIREKIEKSELAQDDRDAMGECVSTFAAAIGDATKRVLGEDQHFVLRKATLDIAELDVPETLVVAGAALAFGDLAKGRFEIIVPPSLWSREPTSAEKRRPPDDDPLDLGGSASVDLTAEELAAIRAATQSGLPGKTLIVVPSLAQRAEWTALLDQSGLDFEFVGDPFQLLNLCRTATIDGIVIDADACPSGGLTVLAALRGRLPELVARVVVASQPTRTHFVSCLAAGATAYMAKPCLAHTLREHLDER